MLMAASFASQGNSHQRRERKSASEAITVKTGELQQLRVQLLRLTG